MKRSRINEGFQSMSEVRTGTAFFLKQIHHTKRPLVITQHGKGVAVLSDAGEYKEMQKIIEIIQDTQTSPNQIEIGHRVEHDYTRANIMKGIRK